MYRLICVVMYVMMLTLKMVDVCSDANIENGVNRFGGVVVDVRSDVDVIDEGVSFDVCGDANVVNDADRSACT